MSEDNNTTGLAPTGNQGQATPTPRRETELRITTAPGGDDPPRYLRRTPTTRRYAASPLRRAMTDDTNEYDEKTRRPTRRSHETTRRDAKKTRNAEASRLTKRRARRPPLRDNKRDGEQHRPRETHAHSKTTRENELTKTAHRLTGRHGRDEKPGRRHASRADTTGRGTTRHGPHDETPDETKSDKSERIRNGSMM